VRKSRKCLSEPAAEDGARPGVRTWDVEAGGEQKVRFFVAIEMGTFVDGERVSLNFNFSLLRLKKS